MANNIYQLKPTDDWGKFKDSSNNERAATGAEVQEFIKSQLTSKIGYWHCESISNTMNRMFGFMNQDNYNAWSTKYDVDNRGSDNAKTDLLVLCFTDITKGTPSPYYDVRVESLMDTPGNKYITIDGKVDFSVRAICDHITFDENSFPVITPQSVRATLIIEVTMGQSYYKTKRIEIAQLKPIKDQNKIRLDDDVWKDLVAMDGVYLINIKLDADTSDGRKSSSYTTFTVVKTQIDVDLVTEWYKPQYITNDRLELRFNCQGSNVTKYLHYRITGAGDTTGSYPLQSNPIKVNNVTQPIYISKNTYDGNYNIASHGLHTIEYWMTLEDSSNKFSTPHKTAQIMVVTDDKDTTPYLILKDVQGLNDSKPLLNYVEQEFFKYSVYMPTGRGSYYTNVDLIFNFKTLVGSGLNQTYENLLPPISMNATGGAINELRYNIELSDLKDKKTMYLGCQTSQGQEVICDVNPMYINNNEDYAPSSGATFIFNPKLRSNDESSDSRMDIYNDANVDELVASKDDWSSNISFQDIDGWIEDPQEGRCLRLLRGQSLKLNHRPFKLIEPDQFNITFEMSFKINNIINPDIPIVSICNKEALDDNGKPIYKGFELRPSDGYFLNRLPKNRENLNKNDIMFAEGERIHLALRIGIEKPARSVIQAEVPYQPGIYHSTTLDTDRVFIRMYLNGVLNRVVEVPSGSVIDYDGLEFGPGYNAGSEDTQTNEIVRYIQLGNIEEAADIDIYEIRVYQDSKLKSNSDILKDYTSTLPSTIEKDILINRNDILAADESTNNVFRNTDISYDQCVKKGINTLLWCPGTASHNDPNYGLFTRPNGREFGDQGKTSNIYNVGDLNINIFDDNGYGRILNKDKSGVFHNMTTEGQGTTAMLYFKWNQRYKFEDIENHNDVGFVSTAAQEKAMQEGSEIKYESKYKLNDNDPIIKRLDAKINWASSMQSHKMGSTALYNDLQKKVVGGHAMNFLDSENAFKDLNLEQMGAQIKTEEGGKVTPSPAQAFTNACKFTGRTDGYAACRTAIRQEPFAYFVQPTKDAPQTFYGMLTFGASKGDKPTFGYNKEFNPYFIMIEGTDNNRKLIEGKTPWDDVHYQQRFKSSDGEMEVDGGIIDPTIANASGEELQQFEISMGDKGPEMIGEHWDGKNPCLRMFKDMMNFIYLHNPYVYKYSGSYTELINDPSIDKNYTYIVTDGGGVANFGRYTSAGDDPIVDDPSHPLYRNIIKSGDIFRYSFSTYKRDGETIEEGWVPAGLTEEGWDANDSSTRYYNHLNIADQLGIDISLIRNYDNSRIQTARATRFKDGYKTMSGHAYQWHDIYPNGISDFMDVDDLKFTTCFIKLIAGTDNWSKNTYIYNPGLYFKYDENTKGYGPKVDKPEKESDFRGSALYDGLSKFGFFQDDLDTIFEIDNYGTKTKPYYVEEQDYEKNSKNEKEYYWNSHDNALYSIMYIADPHQMKSTMRSILEKMSEIAGSTEKCFEKYYQDKAQNYFPEVIYNTAAEKLYMDGWYRGKAKINNIELVGDRYGLTLSQCLGGQASAEKEWQKKRSIYLSSYAACNEFLPGTSGSGLDINPEVGLELTVTPYMWLYPSISTGSSPQYYTGSFEDSFYVPGRVPAGQQITFKMNASGEDSLRLKGHDYYQDFGNLARMSPIADFYIKGERLSNIRIEGTEALPITFDAPAFVSTKGAANNIKNITIQGYTAKINGAPVLQIESSDLQHLWRLENLNLTSTGIKKVLLKPGSNIKTIILPEATETVNLISQTQLSNINLNNLNHDKVKYLDIEYPNQYLWGEFIKFMRERVRLKKAPLNGLTLRGFRWEGMDLATLEYILSCSNVHLYGTIILNADVIIDYNLKNRLLDKFIDIDNEQGSLYIQYTKLTVDNINDAKIIGDKNIFQPGIYKFKLKYLNSDGLEANDFKSITWRIEGVESKYIKVLNDRTGLIQCTRFPDHLSGQSIYVWCDVLRSTNSQGGEETAMIKHAIELSKPDAAVGDYLYADGTYGHPDEYTGLKTIVGTCFLAYYDEELQEQKRLAVARDIGYFVKPDGSIEGYSWGPNAMMYYAGDTQISSNIGYTKYIDDELAPQFPDVTKRVDTFYTNNYNDTSSARHIWYVDYIYAKLLKRTDLYHYFKQGNYNDLTSNNGTGGTVFEGDEGWKEYTQLGFKHVDKCKGYRNTQAILQYRDLCLKALDVSNRNNLDTMEKFQTILTKATSEEAKLKYCPAATYCNLYEPTNLKDATEFSGNGEIAEALSDKLKKGNWFLPSVTELFRIMAYIIRRVDHMDSDKPKHFLKAFQYYIDEFNSTEGRRLLDNKYFSSSSEYSSSVAWRLWFPTIQKNYNNQTNVADGNFTGNNMNKDTKSYIFPCVEF